METAGAARWRRWLAFAVSASLTASCGARWSDEERAAVFARSTASAQSGAIATTAPATDPAEEVVVGPADDGAGATGTGGVATAGPSTPTGGGASGPRPCAAPSNAPGVTAEKLTLANLATVSGPVPGLGATAQEATRAYVAYRNSAGGVCGRRVELLTGDDGNDGTRSRALVTDFAPKALAIMGLFAPSSGAAAELIEQAKMPVTGTLGDEQIRAVSTTFNLNPPPADPKGTIEKYRFLRSQGVTTAAVGTLSAAASVKELDQTQAQIEAAGIRIVSRQILPVATLSFDAAARVVANSKADYLFFLGAAQHDAAMARSIRDTGYRLKFEEYPTGYGSAYDQIAGVAAEGTSTWLRSLPTEEAASNPEMRIFLEWMRRTSPGTPTDVFAVDAWAASKAMVDAIEQLPGPISREAVVAQLRTFHDYDGAGIFGRIDLGRSRSKGCLIGVRLEGGTWRRIAPAQGFLC